MRLKNLWLVAAFGLSTVPARTNQGPQGWNFAAGESAQYRVRYGILGRVGTATLSVTADSVRGIPTYHARYVLKGGIPGFRIDDQYDSWMDKKRLFSLRFEQRISEGAFKRHRQRDFFPLDSTWTGITNKKAEHGPLGSSEPLDDISFLFYVRTLNLEVGQEYVLNRYWDAQGNPVRVKVLRRETVKISKRSFNTVVVQPIIKTSGMFGDGGSAEVHFSEDPGHQLVMMRVKMAIGRLKLELEEPKAGK